jgi:hypothetical protein
MAGESIDITLVVAGVATAMTVACGWPQLRRLRITGDLDGVSLSTATLSVAAESGWLIYLSGQHLWSALPESVLTLSVSLVLSVAMMRAGSRGAAAIGAAGAWGAALVAASVIGGPAAIGALLSVTYGVQLAPSVWTAWRAACPSGVSPASWTVRLVQSALWGAYGAVCSDPPLLILGVIGTGASAAVLARVAVTRPRPATIGSGGGAVVALPSKYERQGRVGRAEQAA